MNVKHDKEKVLQTGMKLFWCTGYSKLGVDEICKTTGMTKGAFYNAFKSKENFLLSCMQAYGNMNVNHLDKQLNSKKGKAIDRILNTYINMFENQPQKNYIGCMTNNMMSEIGSFNETVSKATAEAFENLLVVIEPVVQEAQKDGDISTAINSKSITELIHTTFFGALTRAKSTRDYRKGIATMTLLIKSLKSI
ncbi:MAG: TetR/AcrR family transcriptional repressor of nem operon [Saprospiraceae bacterium]|jgi:TetR/AcrR family transcriptional repressor of nem operon